MKCVDGRPIGKIRNKGVAWFEPGPCQVCGYGPLHGAFTNCPCSYWKNEKRVCHECAIGVDYVLRNESRITGAPFNREEVLRMRGLIERGLVGLDRIRIPPTDTDT